MRVDALLSAPLLTLGLFVGGCGLDPVGVTNVDIALAPLAVAAAPVGFGVESLPLAAGHVHASPPSGTGAVLVTGLPPLQPGLIYRVWLGFADGERSLFPGAVVAAAGHVHGALRAEDGNHAAAPDASVGAAPATSGALTAVPAGDLVSLGGGSWQFALAANRLGKWELSTLRAAAIVLTATSTTVRTDSAPFAAAAVLVGRAGATGVAFDPLASAGHQHSTATDGSAGDATSADAEPPDVEPADGGTPDLGAPDAGAADATGGHVHGDQ